MTGKSVWYRVLDHCEDSRYGLTIPAIAGRGYDWVATLAAEHYQTRHEWGEQDNLTFAIHLAEDGPEVARFSVERVLEFRYSARNINRGGNNDRAG